MACFSTWSSSKQIDAPGRTLKYGGKQECCFPGKSQEPSEFVAKRFQIKPHSKRLYLEAFQVQSKTGIVDIQIGLKGSNRDGLLLTLERPR